MEYFLLPKLIDVKIVGFADQDLAAILEDALENIITEQEVPEPFPRARSLQEDIHRV